MNRLKHFLFPFQKLTSPRGKAVSVLATVFVMLLSLGSLAQAAERRLIVIFNANWCASCREVVPMINEVARQNGIPVREIDVDDQRAPSQARSYGLDVPNSDPPQVYLVDNGHVSLVFDGRNYQYGRGDQIRARLLQNLQRELGPGASGR
jgi:thiol-disulfide isomerase/thioredoxin